MRVLIICYCYPPDPGPRAYRWSAIAEYWAGQGMCVHVISARKQGAAPEEILNGVHVHRVGGAVSENLRLLLEHKKDGAPTSNAPGGGRLSPPGRLLKAVHDLTWKKVYWPDSTGTWFFPARSKALKLCSEITFDGLISTSTPYTGHLVGKAVKLAHKQISWIVDIGDPFSFGQPPWNNGALYKSLNHRSEAAVLKLADAVCVTVGSCKQAYDELFPGVAAKTTVIPPLFSGSPTTTAIGSDRKRRLVFTGSLYRDIRNPAYLLKLLTGVFALDPRIEAHFYGRLNDCADLFDGPLAQYPHNLFVHGLVTRSAAAKALDQAHGLINIANTTRHQLPSKLADYMATGKPIINVVSIENDNSVAFLKDYPQTVTFMDGPETSFDKDAQKIVEFITESQPVPPQMVEALLRPYRVEAIEAQYRKLF